MKLENNFTIDVPIDNGMGGAEQPRDRRPLLPRRHPHGVRGRLVRWHGESQARADRDDLQGQGHLRLARRGRPRGRDRGQRARLARQRHGERHRDGVPGGGGGLIRTAVSMITDMTITGKPAQFGRGVIADVTDKIIGQFAACVARKLCWSPRRQRRRSRCRRPRPPRRHPTFRPRPHARARRAAAPAGGSEAISDSVPEHVGSTNGCGTGHLRGGGASECLAEVAPDSATTTPITTPSTTTRSASASAGGTGLRAPVHSEVDTIDLLDHAGANVLQRLVPVLAGGLLLVLVVLLVRRLRARLTAWSVGAAVPRGGRHDGVVRTGPNNALTDVAGLRVGHARVPDALSGTTVVLAPPRGWSPGWTSGAPRRAPGRPTCSIPATPSRACTPSS